MLKAGYILGNRYKVIKPLGQGGQSNVYLLKDLRLKGKKWVAKEMVAQYTDPRDQALAKKHFEQEANMLATLDHVNLPRVIDYFAQEGKYYLIMQYIKGEDLGRLLEKRGNKPFSDEQVAKWAIQTATVLYYLHCQEKPIIFRDIKPANIMLSGGSVKLIDFGIARHFNPAKKGDTLRIGSPGYSPPEQYSGQTDPRSDIYSLGVTMHHLLTGRDPAASDTPFQLPPIKAFNPNVSSKMISIVEKATQLDPDKRYETILDMKKDLQELVDQKRTTLATPANTPAVPHGVKTPGNLTVPNTPRFEGENELQTPVKTNFMPLPQGEQPEQLDKNEPSKPGEAEKEPEKVKAGEKPVKTNGARKRFPILALVIILLVAGFGFLIYSYYPAIIDFITPSGQPATSPTAEPTGDEPDLLGRGKSLYSSGGFKKALQIFRRMRSEEPGNPLPLIYLNNLYVKMAKTDTVNVSVITDDKLPAGSIHNFLRGIALNQQKINLQGGIQGKKLLILPVTYISEPPDIEAARENSPVVLFLLLSNENLEAVSRIVKNWGIPGFMYSPGSETQNFLVNFNPLGLSSQLKALAKAMAEKKYKNISIIYDSKYEKDAQDTARSLEKPGNIISLFSYQGHKLEFDTTLDQIARQENQGILIAGDTSQISYLLNQIKKKGITAPVYLPVDSIDNSYVDSGVASLTLFSATPYIYCCENSDLFNFVAGYENSFSGILPDTNSLVAADMLWGLEVLGNTDGLTSAAISSSLSSPGPEKLLKSMIRTGINGAVVYKDEITAEEKVKMPGEWTIIKSDGTAWKKVGGLKI